MIGLVAQRVRYAVPPKRLFDPGQYAISHRRSLNARSGFAPGRFLLEDPFLKVALQRCQGFRLVSRLTDRLQGVGSGPFLFQLAAVFVWP